MTPTPQQRANARAALGLAHPLEDRRRAARKALHDMGWPLHQCPRAMRAGEQPAGKVVAIR